MREEGTLRSQAVVMCQDGEGRREGRERGREGGKEVGRCIFIPASSLS